MRLIKMFSAVGLHRRYDSTLPQTPGVSGDAYQTPLSTGGAVRGARRVSHWSPNRKWAIRTPRGWLLVRGGQTDGSLEPGLAGFTSLSLPNHSHSHPSPHPPPPSTNSVSPQIFLSWDHRIFSSLHHWHTCTHTYKHWTGKTPKHHTHTHTRVQRTCRFSITFRVHS